MKAHYAVLMRITGAAPDIFDAEFFRKRGQPLYYLTDQEVPTPPKGPPDLRRAADEQELLLRACAEGRNVFYVEISTTKTVRLKRGGLAVEIGYKASFVNWRTARWRQLPARVRSQQTKPVVGPRHYGAWGSFIVVAMGSGIQIHECAMIVS